MTPTKKKTTTKKPVRKSAKQSATVKTKDAQSKSAKVLEMLTRPQGATSHELMDATGWQAHSLRGFISAVLKKKRGLTVIFANEMGL